MPTQSITLKQRLDQALCGQLTDTQKSFLLKDSVYFGESYPLKDKLKANRLLENYKHELVPVPHHATWIKMYSVASSARLCYLSFRDTSRIQFEHLLTISGSVKAHYDAYDPANQAYYECKYHEIAVNSHEPTLKAKYYADVLLKLGYEGIEEKDGILFPTLRQFGIDAEEGRTIYRMHFDFKQLITHISGMINQQKSGKLIFIFFIPDIAHCGIDKKIDKLYVELENEVNVIKESGFAAELKKFGITMEFKFCSISSLVKELV